MIGWLIRLSKGYRWRILLSIILGSLTIFSSIGLFGTSAYLISMAAYQPSIAVLQVAIVGVRFFGISRAVFRYLERLVSHSVNLKLLASLRSWIYENLLSKFPIRNEELSNTDVLNVLIQSVDVLENFYVRLFSPVVVAFIVSISTALFFGLYSLELFLIIIFGLGLTGFLLPGLAENMGKQAGFALEKSRLVYKEEIASFTESYQELSVLQASDRIMDQIYLVEKNWAKQKNRHNFLQSLFSMLSFYSTQGVFLLVLVVAAGLVMNQSLDAVMMAVLSLICLASFEAVINLPVSAQLLGDVRAAVNQIRKLELSDNSKPVIKHTYEQPISFSDGVKIKNLRFRYFSSADDVLSDINLQLSPGKKIAIVGESGSGKSTLLNILLGFYPDYEGEIFINGADGHQISDHQKRDYFAYMSANPYFFDTSLIQNFQLANPNIEENTVNHLLDQVGLTHLPEERIQTVKEFLEGGVQFSAGEFQRLDLARALVREAEVYLLDEPTANLDPLLGKKIFRSILNQLKEKSAIFVTHQYFYMDHFDEIIVLYKGKIIEQGKHQALLDRKGYYFQLYRAHFPEISHNLSH
ncbi:MAG: thiol reductant ABC exporter subunit CydC [Anaerolineaceae bacterium]|nr:thiol reductant ABC exporter subunit CydC [Anaerolineaceae bacterium]